MTKTTTSALRAIFSSSVVALVAILATSSAYGTLIVDGFDDGGRTNSPGGINWYAINGLSGAGSQKPGLTIIDDAAGIGSGNALAVEAIGSNSEALGVLGQAVSLGPNVGDRVELSFDFRVNGDNNGGDLRFGIYQDTDGELGTSGWGVSDGDFDSNSPGVVGDTGYYLRIPLQANGNGARINDEANANTILGGGGDQDFVAAPASGTFSGISDSLPHTITFSVERTGAGVNDLLPTLDLDGVSFGGADGNDTIPSALSYDYFVAVTTSDTDWIIDNFRIESINAIPEPSSLLLCAMPALVASRSRRR